MGLLDSINLPDDLKRLSRDQLHEIAEEIRERIIDVVSKNGGHLASNLGVVELTIAIHYVFDLPKDKVIWDVGHQAYAHKLLTGRKDSFSTLRQYNGISGFPRREESPYDIFGTGHSSTSISAALGLAEARDRKGETHKVLAVIGDGAMTAGIAFEGLNQTGHLKKDIIVILNDNEMSISPNVGALSSYLNRILTGDISTRIRKKTESLLKSIPMVGEPMLKVAKLAEDTIKGLITPGMLFEELGFEYIGPIDGHRVDILIDTFENIKKWNSPILIHVLTKKGKGYKPAEDNPSRYHGVSPFVVETGEPRKRHNLPSYSEVFGDTLIKLAKKDSRIIGITAAMPEGTGLDRFAKIFPERFFDVGIAEQHAVTFAAGLSAEGMLPVVAIYSTFLQRAYDQVLHDVCLQNLSVTFAMDRAGIVGDDGPTHNGLFDIAYLRHLPNMIVMAPKDEDELQHMLKTAILHEGPTALRYPRGLAVGVTMDEEPKTLEIGRAEMLKDGSDAVIIAIGNMVIPSLEASRILEAEGISVAVINARFVKPLDKEVILNFARKTGKVITVEEHALEGGFGSAVLELLADNHMNNLVVKRMGLENCLIPHGSQAILREKCGLNVECIADTVRSLLAV
ncbi:MAG: 1-deoxy-D-xylulose-5-phosphate synthase [Nitrospirota bacterium]